MGAAAEGMGQGISRIQQVEGVEVEMGQGTGRTQEVEVGEAGKSETEQNKLC